MNKQDDISEVVQKAVADVVAQKEQEASDNKETQERRQLWDRLPKRTKLALARRKAGRNGKKV